MKTEAEILAVIEAAKSSCSIWEFQQVPGEMARLVHYLLSQDMPIKNYLEIGAGAGIVAKTTDELFGGFERLHVIDNNGYDFSMRDRAKRLPQAVEWIGDSSTQECRDAIAAWGVTFDLVFIDGGHTYAEVKADTVAVSPWLHPGSFVAFHDKGWAYDKEDGTPDRGVKGWLAETESLAALGLTETLFDSWVAALYRYEAG